MNDYYLIVELYSFETAKYLSQLSHLLSSFGRLKQIKICSKNNYAEPQESRKRKITCSLDIPDLIVWKKVTAKNGTCRTFEILSILYSTT